MTAGTLLALPLLAPLVLIGSHTATNMATSSAAALGVRGRLGASALALALMVVSTAVGVWTAGVVLVAAAAARLVGTPGGDGALAVAYTALTVASVVLAVYGYSLLLRANFILMLGGAAAALLMLVAFAGDVDLSYGGGQYALGDFWSTWWLAVLAIGVGGVMLISTAVADWARYIPARRYPPAGCSPSPWAAS
jgi:hypothetical protein